MTRAALIGTVAAASFLSVAPAYAASLVGPQNNLQGIDGLQIGSTIFDVRFRPGSFNSTFDNPAGAKPLPTFLNNALGAADAVNAINAFFNSIGFGDKTTNPEDGIIGNVSTQYLIPFLADTANNGLVTSKLGDYQGTPPTGNWVLGSDLTDNRNGSKTPSYAEFTNGRAVPTPALLPGLIALGAGVLRKRKTEKNAEVNADA